MNLFAIPVLVGLLGQGDDPAKVMKAVDEKVGKADTLQTNFDAKIEGSKGNGTMKGTVSVAPGGKARLEADLDIGGMAVKLQVVSDGSKLKVTVSGMEVESKDTPKNMRGVMTVLLSRAGVGAMILAPKKGDDDKGMADPFESVKLSGLKKVKAEKVGDRDAVVIDFALDIKDQPVKLNGTVWVDTVTNLPLKRVLRAEMGGETATVTETYANFRINPKLDGKLFQFGN
jgi:outer membrane lipoprotein-sorting protein